MDSCISKPCISSEFDIPFQMVASCTLASRTISFFGWVSTFIVESLFLFLIIRRTCQLKKMSGDYSLVNDGAMARGGGITSVMARDSKKYFLMSVSVYIKHFYTLASPKLHSLSGYSLYFLLPHAQRYFCFSSPLSQIE